MCGSQKCAFESLKKLYTPCVTITLCNTFLNLYTVAKCHPKWYTRNMSFIFEKLLGA